MLKNYNVVITGGNAVNKKSRKKSILEIIPEYYGNIIFMQERTDHQEKKLPIGLRVAFFSIRTNT